MGTVMGNGLFGMWFVPKHLQRFFLDLYAGTPSPLFGRSRRVRFVQTLCCIWGFRGSVVQVNPLKTRVDEKVGWGICWGMPPCVLG